MKKIITSMLLVIFFIGCKKESIEKLIKQEKGVTVNDAKVFLNNLSDLKTESENGHGFNPKSLLEKIDWKNASQIDSGKILIGKFDGAPTENGTKLGFRKVVFDKNADGEISLYILEFAPDIFHLWKYKGINKKSFDGKIIVYDQNYKLLHGYVLKAGKIIGEILPVKQNTIQVDSDIKNDISITTCTQSGGSRINSEGYEEAYILLSCNTEYFFNHGNHVSTQLQQVEGESVDEFIGGGGGGGIDNFNDENPVNYFELESTEDGINLKDKIDCFKNVPDNSNTNYSAKLCTDLPNNNNPNALVGSDKVGHAFVTITKTNGNIKISQTFGFYPQIGYKSLIGSDVPSQIQDDGESNHQYDASLSYNLDKNNFDLILNAALSYSNRQYNLSEFNCTDFALSVINAGISNKIVVNDWIVNSSYYANGYGYSSTTNYGTTPSGLYKKINELKNNANPNASISSSSKAPVSSKCN
jgi:hypothetical protein